MNPPIIEVWGPALWSIFHILAEKTGHKPNEAQEHEEKRLWRFFLLALRSAIPCPRCQAHYNDYIQKNPLHPLFLKRGAEWGIALRHYLWTFHCSVRQSKGQPLDFPIERLEEYRLVPREILQGHLSAFGVHLHRGLPLQMITREDMMRLLRVLQELVRL